MGFERKWYAFCDADGCDEVAVFPGSWDRNDVGLRLNDEGWQAGPGTRVTHCPNHWIADEEWAALMPQIDPEVEERAVRALADAIAEADARSRRSTVPHQPEEEACPRTN